MDPYLGEIRMFGFNYQPSGWAVCDGRLLSIAQNSALFALLGTTYGGDGMTTFGLPDLRGRVAMGMGNGPGLAPPSNRREGRERKCYTIRQPNAGTCPPDDGFVRCPVFGQCRKQFIGHDAQSCNAGQYLCTRYYQPGANRLRNINCRCKPASQ